MKKVEATSALTIYDKMGKGLSGVLSSEQILFIMQRTPDEHIYKRPGKGGQTWDYVTGTYVEKVLNYVFGWDWDFIVKEVKEGHGQIAVLGELVVRTIDGKTITKNQWGRIDVKYKKGTTDPLDYGNDLKGASTDSLKKCASLLGIASDVYGKEEFKEIKTREVVDPINVAATKERQRIIDHINSAKDATELRKCEIYIADQELKDLYDGRMVDFMAKDAQERTVAA